MNQLYETCAAVLGLVESKKFYKYDNRGGECRYVKYPLQMEVLYIIISSHFLGSKKEIQSIFFLFVVCFYLKSLFGLKGSAVTGGST